MLLRITFIACICTSVHSYNTGKDQAEEAHEFLQYEAKVCRQKDFLQEHTVIMRQSLCSIPKDTVVQLISVSHNIKYTPSSVVVKRCSGMCSSHLACLPLEVRQVMIPVRQHSLGDNTPTCGVVTVEEHVRCRCGCDIKKEHCNGLQIYNESDCECQCQNKEDKTKCENSNRLWNQRDCTCNCKQDEKQCPAGLNWVPSFCKCMKVSESVSTISKDKTIS